MAMCFTAKHKLHIRHFALSQERANIPIVQLRAALAALFVQTVTDNRKL
jgi:hypothetical protein